MNFCHACQVEFDTTPWTCPFCHSKPDKLGEFETFAEDLAKNGSGFDGSYFGELASYEGTNFWFRARNEIIVWVLREQVGSFRSFIEVGCGTGFVVSRIAAEFPHARVWGSEIFVEGLEWAAKRIPPEVRLIQMDAREIPFANEFDVVGAFDVLEHIEEDLDVLAEIHRALSPEGYVVLTVPQHTWLWSKSDEYAHHVRRYAPGELEGKLRASGFHIVRSTSFVTSLLPALMVSRAMQKLGAEYVPTAELALNPLLNRAFEALLNTELRAIRAGFDFPVGGSRLVIAKKQP